MWCVWLLRNVDYTPRKYPVVYCFKLYTSIKKLSVHYMRIGSSILQMLCMYQL